MATITALTAQRMLDIEALAIVEAFIADDNLFLTQHNGTQIDAGNVRGPQGEPAPAIPMVTELPTYAIGGDVLYYQNADMADDGVIWTVRYQQDSSNAEKWEFIGGKPLSKKTSISTTSITSWTAFGPTITVPETGIYKLSWRIDRYFDSPGSTFSVYSSPFVNGTRDTSIQSYDTSPAGLVQQAIDVRDIERSFDIGDTVQIGALSTLSSTSVGGNIRLHLDPIRLHEP